MPNEKLTAYQEVNLIAGRIIDEHRKHNLSDWHLIAAKKIHAHWKEYFESAKQSRIEELEKEVTKAYDLGIQALIESQNQLKATKNKLDALQGKGDKVAESLIECIGFAPYMIYDNAVKALNDYRKGESNGKDE